MLRQRLLEDTSVKTYYNQLYQQQMHKQMLSYQRQVTEDPEQSLWVDRRPSNGLDHSNHKIKVSSVQKITRHHLRSASKNQSHLLNLTDNHSA